MKILIIYDSFFGNTEIVAKTIKETLPETDVELKNVSNTEYEDILDIDLLIMGSPTRIFKPSPLINKFIKQMPKGFLINKKIMVFDTRGNPDEVDSKFLAKMMNRFGFAAEKIAKRLQKKGGTLLGKPQGFYVEGTEGPLQENEVQNTLEWIKNNLK